MSDKYIIEYDRLTDDEVKGLISECEAEIERRRNARLVEVQESIKQLADSVGMTPDELVQNMKKGKAPAQKVIRFRNDENHDETWSGRGKRPNWVNAALEQGRKLEDFRVSH